MLPKTMTTTMEDQVLFILQYKLYSSTCEDHETDDENERGDIHNDLNVDDGLEVHLTITWYM